MSDDSSPKLRRSRLRHELRLGCAIAHDEPIKPHATLLDLIEFAIERGLPSRSERERIRAERLQEDNIA